jgi:hypothetical protein
MFSTSGPIWEGGRARPVVPSLKGSESLGFVTPHFRAGLMNAVAFATQTGRSNTRNSMAFRSGRRHFRRMPIGRQKIEKRSFWRSLL